MLTLAVLLLLAQAADDISDYPAATLLRGRMQMEMNACAAGNFEAADKTLNEQWQQTLALMRDRDEVDDDARRFDANDAEALLQGLPDAAPHLRAERADTRA